MHVPSGVKTRQSPSAVLSILYLRCFGSFERTLELWRRLSILYLRCQSLGEVGIPSHASAFNSLFEMHQGADRGQRRRSRRKLSILYLRCGGVDLGNRHGLDSILSILYLRCPEIGGLLAGMSISPFQFSI